MARAFGEAKPQPGDVPPASPSRIGQSGRASPWQCAARCRSVVAMADRSRAFASSASTWERARRFTFEEFNEQFKQQFGYALNA